MLYLVQRVFFGPVREPTDGVPDLNLREIGALAPLAVFVLWIGLQPDVFLRRMAPAIERSTAAARQQADALLEQQPAEPQELASRRAGPEPPPARPTLGTAPGVQQAPHQSAAVDNRSLTGAAPTDG
jgi:NADH-quinone oxidoreductase subunit M